MARCKWAKEYADYVPMPFGIGSCAMTTSDCVYDGDKQVPDDECYDDERCPAYEPYEPTEQEVMGYSHEQEFGEEVQGG